MGTEPNTHFGIRFLTALLPSLISFKVRIAVCLWSEAAPEAPFNSFKVVDWLRWIISWSDFELMILITLFFFLIAFVALRNLPRLFVGIWGALLGLYVSQVYVGKFSFSDFDGAIEWIYPLGESKLFDTGAVIVVLSFVLTLPLILAWLLGILSRWMRKPNVKGA